MISRLLPPISSPSLLADGSRGLRRVEQHLVRFRRQKGAPRVRVWRLSRHGDAEGRGIAEWERGETGFVARGWLYARRSVTQARWATSPVTEGATPRVRGLQTERLSVPSHTSSGETGNSTPPDCTGGKVGVLVSNSILVSR